MTVKIIKHGTEGFPREAVIKTAMIQKLQDRPEEVEEIANMNKMRGPSTLVAFLVLEDQH